MLLTLWALRWCWVSDMLLTLWALRWCWVSDMLLTLWALRWCWVGMLAVVAYLRHADSKGVSSPGTLCCAPRTGLWQGVVAPRR